MATASSNKSKTADQSETSGAKAEKSAGQIAHSQIAWDKTTLETALSKEKKVPHTKVISPDDLNAAGKPKLQGQVMILNSNDGPFVTVKGNMAFDKQVQTAIKSAGGKAIMTPQVDAENQPIMDPANPDRPLRKFDGMKFELQDGAAVIYALSEVDSPKAPVVIKALKATKALHDKQQQASRTW